MKTAIVTGASGNLGKAVVEHLLADGYHVTGTVFRHRSNAGSSSHLDERVADLGKEDEAEDLVTSVVDKYKRIDVAVLTVGGFAAGKLEDTGIENIREQIRLNFDTAYNVARPVFKQMMKQQAGRIFLVGSRPALDIRAGQAMLAYSLAKSLVVRLAESLNESAGKTDVVTSLIVPGTIDTPQNREGMPKSDFSKWVKPEDIAKTILFHCSGAGRILREPVLKVYGQS